MKTFIIFLALAGAVYGDISCIKISEDLTICTNDDTGEEYDVWTY